MDLSGLILAEPLEDCALNQPTRTRIGGKMSQYPDLANKVVLCLLYTSPSPRDGLLSRMPSSA